MSEFVVCFTCEEHVSFAEQICYEIEQSSLKRGTGIAKRSVTYIQEKIRQAQAVIALTADNKWAGFCYIESWESNAYVVNSGLIVSPEFRQSGLAKRIKEKIFELSTNKYPESKIFGLTTGLAVMKINSELGYQPVTYSELTQDEQFWHGCKSCVNFAILESKQFKNCLCTAMLYDPNNEVKKATNHEKTENTISL